MLKVYCAFIKDHKIADIDECKENFSGCNQNCTNTNGSFTCSCYSSGYDLVNGNTCTGSWAMFVLVLST